MKLGSGAGTGTRTSILVGAATGGSDRSGAAQLVAARRTITPDTAVTFTPGVYRELLPVPRMGEVRQRSYRVAQVMDLIDELGRVRDALRARARSDSRARNDSDFA